MATTVIQKHQTLVDIALQECGSTEALFELADLNGFSPTDDVAPGTVLLLPDVVDQKKVKYLRNAGIKVVTVPVPKLQGLGVWALQLDFTIM